MDIALAVLADGASIDRNTGTLSIFGIFDQITVGSFPAAHVGAHLVMVFATTPMDVGRHKTEIMFIDEDGNLGLSIEVDGDVAEFKKPDLPGRVNLVAALPPIPVQHAGLHLLDIRLDGRFAASVPLVVVTADAG